MKKNIHPQQYRMVIIKDVSCDESFLTRSCAASKENAVWTDGNEYPVVKVEISAASHPFFTGKMTLVDTAGRIDRFNKKYGKKA
jgi:large subunit ribosomal protein L31